MFVQKVKSSRGKEAYYTYLVRESYRGPDGPRSRTVCNITELPPEVRIAKAEAALKELASRNRKKPDAQKLASQAGRLLQWLKAHKYYNYLVNEEGKLQWHCREEVIAAEGWYLLRTNLNSSEAAPFEVLVHYKSLLSVEEAFCDLKSYLEVRAVFHSRPDRVVNHVRLCFIAYWLSARLAQQWREKGFTGDVPRTLRRLQTIRLGRFRVLGKEAPAAMTPIPSELNDLLEQVGLLGLFSAPYASKLREVRLVDQFEVEDIVVVNRKEGASTFERVLKLYGNHGAEKRFIPYLSMFEMEALLFSNAEVLAGELKIPRKLVDHIIEEAGEPEKINEHPQKAPSKRLEALYDRYKKTTTGIRIAEAIGINAMKAACPLFGAWVTKLENLKH